MTDPDARDAAQAALTAAQDGYVAAWTAWQSARERLGPAAERFRAAQRAEAEALAAGTTGPEFTGDDMADGTAAVDIIDSYYRKLVGARGVLAETIAAGIRDGLFTEGDDMVSPVGDVPLRVAEVYVPPSGAAALGEITLTADGLRAERRNHSWPLDDDGRPVRDDMVPVRFERWWGGGFRVGGLVHPISRRIVEVD